MRMTLLTDAMAGLLADGVRVRGAGLSLKGHDTDPACSGRRSVGGWASLRSGAVFANNALNVGCKLCIIKVTCIRFSASIICGILAFTDYCFQTIELLVLV
jgi:hypothetical protein